VRGEIERRRCGVGVDWPMILRCPDWPDLGQVPNQFPLLPVLRLDVCAIFVVSWPRPNSRMRRATTPPSFPLPRQTPLPSHQHPFVQQITVVQPPSSQTGSLISSCTLRRDLASAQAKPAILGPEIGLQVRSILEHPPTPITTPYHPTPPPAPS
jgi:hypothetical protein